MRRLYLDTSLLVAALVHEAGTVTATELASALALQVRRGAITPLAAEDFEAAAAQLCLTQAPPLRAGDALHLALCQRLNLQLASFDSGLCKAAAHYQVAHKQLLI